MKHYLVYSGALHAAAFIILALFIARQARNPAIAHIYTIDMIGMQDTMTQPAQPQKITQPVSKPVPTPPATKTAQPQKIADDIPLKPSVLRQTLLPRPSILAAARQPRLKEPPPPAEATIAPVPTGIMADFPNFPYPWYVAQVRSMLWNEWSSRMPRGGGLKSLVGFKIKRDGSVKGVQAEKTSGNKLFDYAACTSVEQAAPFPPLPQEYKDSNLAVHVEFSAVD